MRALVMLTLLSLPTAATPQDMVLGKPVIQVCFPMVQAPPTPPLPFPDHQQGGALRRNPNGHRA